MKSVGSLVTGQTEKMQEARSPIGDGSNAGKRDAVVSAHRQEEIAKRLATHKPFETDRILLSRLSSLNVEVLIWGDSRIEARGQELDKAISLMGNFMQPATKHMIEDWIAGFSTMVAKRVGDDEAIRLDMYVSQFMRYPADIVYDVLFNQTYKFWPTWFELKPKLDLKNRKRVMILEALKNPTKKGVRPVDERTPQQRKESAERILKEIDSDFKSCLKKTKEIYN